VRLLPNESELLGALSALLDASVEKRETWRRNSLAWAESEFVFEDGLRRFRELFN